MEQVHQHLPFDSYSEPANAKSVSDLKIKRKRNNNLHCAELVDKPPIHSIAAGINSTMEVYTHPRTIISPLLAVAKI